MPAHLVNGDDDFPVGGEDLPLVEVELEVAVVRVDHGEAERPARPVLDRQDATHLVAVPLPPHVLQQDVGQFERT